jgi:Tfp pilus assembly major pilin PilA
VNTVLIFVIAVVLLSPLIWVIYYFVVRFRKGAANDFQEVIIIIAVYVVCGAIGIPAYQEHSLRKKISEALQGTEAPRLAIDEHFRQHKKFPPTVSTAANIRYEAKSGTLVIVLPEGVLNGRSLVMTPTRREGDKLVWVCTSPDIPQHDRKYLSKHCG